ncbi:MAG: sialidase family protein [Myxococcales bacterium]
MNRSRLVAVPLLLALSACGDAPSQPSDAAVAAKDAARVPGPDVGFTPARDAAADPLDASGAMDPRDAGDAIDPRDAGDVPLDPPDASPIALDAGALDAGLDPVLDQEGLSAVAGSSHEHEASVAVSPGGRVVVSWLSFTGSAYTVGYRISNDQGASWGPATLVALPPNTNVQANATVAADDTDTLYLAWASAKKTATGARTNLAVWAARSLAGTVSFEAPGRVTPANAAVGVYDLPRIAVTANGVVNIAYTATSTDYASMWIEDATSSDFKSWTSTITAGPGTPNSVRNFPHLCRSEGSGRIYLAFWDTDLAFYAWGNGVALQHSDDEGKTWSQPVAVQQPADDLAASGMWVDCAVRGDDVWVMYGLSLEALTASAVPTLFGLRLAHSGDHGQTFDFYADPVGKPAAAYMYPRLVGERGGALDLAFYAGSGPNDAAASLRRSRSLDGREFAATVVHQPLRLTTSRTAARWVGDYTGLASSEGNLFLAYTENSSAAPHIALHRTPAELPAPGPSPDGGVPDGGGATPDAGCYADQVFVPVVWAPPSEFAQGACSAGQLTDYDACTAQGDCTAFRAQPGNAGCLACIETDEGAAAHGPVITRGTGAALEVLEYNYGGCQAHVDGQISAGGCGNQLNDWLDCTSLECGGCSDFSNVVSNGPAHQCFYRALSHGRCANAQVSAACYGEPLGSRPAMRDLERVPQGVVRVLTALEALAGSACSARRPPSRPSRCAGRTWGTRGRRPWSSRRRRSRRP